MESQRVRHGLVTKQQQQEVWTYSCVDLPTFYFVKAETLEEISESRNRENIVDRIKKTTTGTNTLQFFMSQYPVSLQVQLILLNVTLILHFLVIHDADILVSNIDYCDNLGLTCLHVCCTFTFLKPCVLLDYIIFLFRHHSLLNWQLIELENLSFIHGHLKSGLIFPFQPYFLLIKSRKPA